MKKKLWIGLCLLILMACGKEKKEEVSLIDHYLELKDALVATDPVLAREAAKLFIEAGPDEAMKAALQIIASTQEVEKQRKAFEILSLLLYNNVKREGTEVPLYRQFCPMAFNDKGAFWLATEPQVNNPYFGDVMLHCGFVQEYIQVQ